MSTMVATQAEVTTKTEVTPEELLAMPDGGHYELIDGELKERRVSALSNLVAAEANRVLGNHCQAHRLGWIFAAEHGYRCFPWKPSKVRRADVTFIRRDRYSLEQLSADGFMTIPPDLAVEVVSPSDGADEVEEKVEEYIRAGVKLIWVVYPHIHIVQVHRADGTSGRFRAHDELSGEDVLPGFRCKVEDLFPKLTAGVAHEPTTSNSDSASREPSN